MSYETNCSEILDLFRAAGMYVPHEDSDMGRAVQILQTICDSQNHTIPEASREQEDIKTELEASGWNFYPGTAASDPYAARRDNEAGTYVSANDNLSLVFAVAKRENISDQFNIASDIFEALEELESHIGEDDFTLDFDGNEYRIINESDIWEIYRDAIEETVKDCYDLKLDELPSFIAVSIDWEETARNAYADGYGHTFSGYDGSEEEAAGYYIFRTN